MYEFNRVDGCGGCRGVYGVGLDRYGFGDWLSHFRVRLNNQEGDLVIQILWTVLMLIIGALLGFGLGGRYRNSVPVEATPTVIGRITELADLVVLRVPVSKVHVTRISGYVGAVDCIVLVNGELEMGTDLMQAQFKKVDTAARRATLMLAEPVVRRARLDHESTSVYRIDRRGLWKVVPSAEPSRMVVNRAMIEAQGCVEAAGEQPELVDRTKQQTEQVLGQFLKAVGWEIKLVWAVEQQSDDSS